MNKFFYFKAAFIPFLVGVLTGTFVFGLFQVNFSNTQEIVNLFVRSLVIGISVGAFLGALNIIFKILPSPKKDV